MEFNFSILGQEKEEYWLPLIDLSLEQTMQAKSNIHVLISLSYSSI